MLFPEFMLFPSPSAAAVTNYTFPIMAVESSVGLPNNLLDKSWMYSTQFGAFHCLHKS
jgi:hypothetical protein